MTAEEEEEEEEEGERVDGGRGRRRRRVCIIRPFKTTMINEGDKARERGRERRAVKKKGTRRSTAAKLNTT